MLYIYYLRSEDSGVYECETQDGRRDQVRLRVLGSGRPVQPVVEEVATERPEDILYAIRSNLREPFIQFRSGDSVTQECNAMTNGDNLEIEWYSPRKQVNFNQLF